VPRPSVDPKDTGQQDYSRNDFRALALEVLGERPCKERLVEKVAAGYVHAEARTDLPTHRPTHDRKQ
jgi:hypothetical protein